jgi:predicted ATP-grasp superfamily ATP-dependent carboligase
MKILIVDGMGIQVVSAIRSLTRLGHCVSIAIPVSVEKKIRKNCRWFYSRYIEHVYYISEAGSKYFTSDLIALLQQEKFDTVLPFGFETTVAISMIKDRVLSLTHTSVADYTLIEQVHDKERLNAFLLEKGFEAPHFYSYETLYDLCKQVIHFPVVVKARKGSGMEKGVRYAADYDELKHCYQEISGHISKNEALADYSKPLVQEYIPGKIYDGCFVCNNGEVVASLLQLRDVTYPITGGVGVNIITVYDDKLMEYCKAILKALQWHGPCQVEVKKDERDNTYKIIEINPKLWGTLGASIHAGIDFSEKACEVAMGKGTPAHEYIVGMKYKILFPLEIFTIYQDKGFRWKRIKNLLEVFRKDVRTEWDFRDPMPNVLSFLITLYVLLLKRNRILPKGESFG